MKTKIIEVKREELNTTLFNRLYQCFSENTKDIVLNGLKFKGIHEMSDNELIKEYKDIMLIKNKVIIIED